MASSLKSIEDESRPSASQSSSDANVFEEVEAEDSQKSFESRTSARLEKLTGTKEKKVTDGVWQSYYHCLVALVMATDIRYWTPDWYQNAPTQGLLAIHFILVMVFIHLPINYMEMFVAQYTKEPPINLWKICPIFLGYCYALIAYSILQSWLDTVFCGRNLLYLIEAVFDQAPWLRCASGLGAKCLVVTSETKLSKDCKVDKNTTLFSCPDRGTFDFSAQHWFKSRYKVNSSTGRPPLDTQWKLVLCSIAHWLIVTLSAARTIYKFGTAIYCIAIAVLVFMLLELIYILYKVDLTALIRIAFGPTRLADFVNKEFWAVAYIGTIWRAHVTTPPLTMSFVARVDSKFSIAWCAIIVSFATFFLVLFKTTTRGALRRLIADALNVDPDLLTLNSGSSGLALIPQHLGTLPMPLMWTFYWFAMRYAVLWLQSTMVVEAILENFFLKNNVRKEFRIYFIGLYCVTACIINVVIVIEQSALPSLNLIYSSIIFTGFTFMPLVESIFILLIYGLGVFIDDVHFMYGSPPSFFWRFCWKLLPFMLLSLYVASLVTELKNGVTSLGTPFLLLKAALIAIIPVFAVKQIMYAVYTENLTYLFNPVFDWGPRDKEVRKARKQFNPKTDIRSQPERTVNYVKPRSSIRALSIE
ncbi:sodium-dependent nutrient amino acid transporter 1-like [Neodiprion lecontei]|uniref:Sodium-dependent nutrient amino acid transporter 1-like n=1 Tax=Neodiprion lecontei TaxID=441921 RepID=A0ABM3GID5_NEOLC|nr:sodium-dependent nutrient amino acid transporter 1-like [Neodiprion lecontei]